MLRLLRLLSGLALIGGTVAQPLRAQTAEASRVLQIRDRVIALAPKVTLAEFAANSAMLNFAEGALEVLDAPAVGGQTRLTLVELAFLLQRHPALLDLQLRGPDAILIERTLPALDVQRLKNKLADAIRQTPPWSAWKIDVLLQAEDERRLSRCDAELSIKIQPLDGNLLSGSVPIRAAFVDSQGARVSDMTLTPVILRETQVVITTGPLNRGHVLREGDLQLAPLWLGDQSRAVLSKTSDCVGRELSRNLSAGEIVQPAHLLNPVCARRGDVVWVRCSSGILTVSIATSALETARLGEQVKVRNPVSGKAFEARLVADRRAELDLGAAPSH